MGRFAIGRAACLCLHAAAWLALSPIFMGARARADDPPGFAGTWHVLIHYQVPDGPHPDRWKWEERIWAIEPSGDDLEWVEHAIVHFVDQSDRFENLGTPLERRLLGAWEPNQAQRKEIGDGLRVGSRGMRSKRLQRVGPGHWRSSEAANSVAQSSTGFAYREIWSIRRLEGEIVFEIDSRFSVAATASDEPGGVTRYVADEAGTGAFQGRYERTGEHRGRFRVAPTRLLVQAVRKRSILSALLPRSQAPIELVPDKTVRDDIPLIVTVLNPAYYYSERRLTIVSNPPGAEIDLAYLRRGTQLMYRRGRAPLEVLLPKRLQAAASDRLQIRGFLPGHERVRRTVSVTKVDEHLELLLPPLPNQVVGVEHGSLAGRSVLELRSEELPTIRIAEDASGWTVVLVRTGLADELGRQVASLRDPQLDLDARQLGDDLVLRLASSGPGPLTLRQQSLTDPSRGQSRTRLELEGPAARGRAALLVAAVDSMAHAPPGPCSARHEETLLARLPAAELSSRLGGDDHPYRATLRAALRRLAELSPGGVLRTRAGADLTTATPLEFELALSRSGEIEGYLSWLRTLARRIDPSDDGALAFRSLVAPGWSPDRFSDLLSAAASVRDRCLLAHAP